MFGFARKDLITALAMAVLLVVFVMRGFCLVSYSLSFLSM